MGPLHSLKHFFHCLYFFKCFFLFVRLSRICSTVRTGDTGCDSIMFSTAYALSVISVFSCSALIASSSQPVDPIPPSTNVQVWTCSGGVSQRWITKTGSYPNNHIQLAVDTKVLDINGWSNDTGANVQVYRMCSPRMSSYATPRPIQVHTPTSKGWNQQFIYNTTNGKILSLMNKFCAEGLASMSFAGTNVVTAKCTGRLNQAWFYNKTDQTFRYGMNKSLCLDAGSSVNCSVSPLNKYPYCNYTLDAETRAKDLISRLQTAEKVKPPIHICT